MQAIWWSRPKVGTQLDLTLRRLVVGFRILGWAWMLLLVVLTLASDDEANRTVVIGAMTLATFWTAVTMWVGLATDQMGQWPFVLLDVEVVLVVGAASTLAGANDLFHGGYPMSGILVAAYAGGMLASLGLATLLTTEQVTVHLVDGRGLVATGGSVIFFIFAVIIGWTFDTLRASDAARRTAETALEEERTRTALQSERVRFADQIHDTVLQTLHAIRLHADDPDQTRYLARRQERQLRRSIASLQSEFDPSYRVELLTVRDEIEDTFPVQVNAVVRHDVEMSPVLEVVVEATQEALRNASKHSHASEIELFSEASDGLMHVHIRDRGDGFDPTRLSPHRGLGRCRVRLDALGGDVVVSSELGSGTECVITGPLA